MINNFTSFLFLFDLIGTTPQLLIFNEKRYKSILSSLISLIIIFASIGFAIFSLTEYLKYDSPIVSYSKDNDDKTNRNYFIKDLLLVFQLIDRIDTSSFNIINESIASYQGFYSIVYNNGSILNIPLEIEKCELGKNVNLKYKNLANSNNTFGRKLEEFYCIGNKNENLSLFYQPNYGFSFITLAIIFKNNNIYKPENIKSIIISQNDLIDHNNKSNPIRESYIFQFTSSYSSSFYTIINYNFQYINYESDEGPFYKQSRILNGISFSDISVITNNEEGYDLQQNLMELKYSKIGEINLLINKSNFDSYKRNYQRLQSLLAEIMSVASLLFEIGRQISNILGYKRMTKDIFDILINKNKEKIFNEQNKDIANLFINKEIKEINSEREKSNNNSNSNIPYLAKKDVKDEIQLNSNIINKNSEVKENNIIDNSVKNINYFHILKSFLCFKDKRTQIINFCYDFINKDICIERILDRFYNLEIFYHEFNTKNKLETNKLGFANNINSQKRKEKHKKLKNDIDKNKTIEKDNSIIK